MKQDKSDESKVKVKEMIDREMLKRIFDLDQRIIALERGLEGVLRRLEESSGPDDEAGWFGRPE